MGRFFQEQRSGRHNFPLLSHTINTQPPVKSAQSHAHYLTCWHHTPMPMLQQLCHSQSCLPWSRCFGYPPPQNTCANFPNTLCPDLRILWGLVPRGGRPCGSPKHTLLKLHSWWGSLSPFGNRPHFAGRPAHTLLKLCSLPLFPAGGKHSLQQSESSADHWTEGEKSSHDKIAGHAYYI